MNKQQILKIVFPILAVIMAYVWGQALFGSSPKSKGDKNSGNVSQISSTNARSVDLTALSRSVIREKTKTSYSDWGRNPFTLGQKQDASLMVEGILWDSQNPKVMISGNILGIGEKVGSVTVVDIKPNTVILRGKDGDVELSSGGSL